MRTGLLLLLSVLLNLPLWAHKGKMQVSHKNVAPVVVVSSYNPDVKSISDNLSAFYEQYTKSGLPNPVVVEDINAQNLPDGKRWRIRLKRVLNKYYSRGNRPACIVLLGMEASSAYLSFDDDEELRQTPVVVGLRGSAIVKMPQDSVDFKEWDPVAYDVTTDFKHFNIVGGEVYHYDMKKNFDLIKHFYPKCDTLTFMSDNTLGGVTMRALFKQYAKTDRRFVVRYIDGRTMTFVDADEAISNLPHTQAMLIGTWRVDNSNRYVVRNTTYAFCKNNPELPTFSISDVGLGHWPVGGYSPCYHIMGGTLADDVVAFLKTGKKKPVALANCKYIFDFNRLQELHLSLDDINVKYEMVNMPISIFKEYFKTIIIVFQLFIVLLSALIVSLYLLKRGKKLRLKLLRQGKELLVAKYNAEQANLMKSRFIANMSHEIRTPLNAVMGFSQILTNEQIELTAEEKKQYGELIMVNGELLLKLIDDVLDISKIDAGKMHFNKGEYDVVSLIKTAAQSALANKKPGVDIMVETRVEHLQIATDRERLLQVLANLLNNAKKCTDSGKITISLDQYPEQRMIKISVSDTGCGIPVEKAEEVFERFKKLDAFRQGTGLGLAICKLIVEELGGKIWVDTDYTDGARFVFTHPM